MQLRIAARNISIDVCAPMVMNAPPLLPPAWKPEIVRSDTVSRVACAAVAGVLAVQNR
ncbi:hypothetical protein D3C83_275800 [compost metagenome]